MINAKIFFSYIDVSEQSSVPKYLQVANSINDAIDHGKICPNELLPSINELNFNLNISRDTAEKSYRYLKKTGVLGSFPGKGFYVRGKTLTPQKRIFMLFNKLSEHKKTIYDAFVLALGDDVVVEFYCYNNSFSLFKNLLRYRKEYDYYVVIPHFREGEESAHKLINQIPKEKLVILDKRLSGIEGNYASVVENFERDIYTALFKALTALQKYNSLKIVFPKEAYLPPEILNGFNEFCKHYSFTHSIVDDIINERLQPGEAYITLTEDDLVVLIERLTSQKLIIGNEVGIISYNETPLKKIISNGITTISTDFKQMGYMAAKLINEGSLKQLEVPFYLNLRASL